MINNSLKTSNDSKTIFSRIFKNKKKQEASSVYGRTVGIVYEGISHITGHPTLCIAQIKRHLNDAEVVLFDSHDEHGTSVTNMIEIIATGIYLEHLSNEYTPAPPPSEYVRYCSIL